MYIHTAIAEAIEREGEMVPSFYELYEDNPLQTILIFVEDQIDLISYVYRCEDDE